MADIADLANDSAQQQLDAALAAISSPGDSALSAHWCDECDTEIPQARRLAAPGCRLCVHCQGMYERHNGGRA